ncbi:midasin [Polyplosphaeria fusca]|uniref:Midasin n=1 Tax=Polyplosphaeria fusca TaxID=682080 RepID=A0A9P4QYY8_9PLEO|nr:midasin [Polyplosphaeria fusca]
MNGTAAVGAMPGVSKRMAWEELTAEALRPEKTDDLFLEQKELFVEISARWISSDLPPEVKIAAFGRILPLAPYLAEHVEMLLAAQADLPTTGRDSSGTISDEIFLRESLLGFFRLLSFDCLGFSKFVRPRALQELFLHPSRPIRFLAVRCFCLWVHAADHATQEMMKRYLGDGEIPGEWEGKSIDYRFLSLWEEKRWEDMQSRDRTRSPIEVSQHLKQTSPLTTCVAGIPLPRLSGPPLSGTSSLVQTPTTQANLKGVAQLLLDSRPLLLTGLAGSGKTLLVRHFAWLLGKLNSMVTLHLNEQTDAKLLVGMYATGAKPGTFSWRPGVLTTAVKEGRWLFIEDLDRAPNEVISTILPLIERGELLIPSRGETVRAARGFRVIATMRSTLTQHGQEIVPRQNMIGYRFWNTRTINTPSLEEFGDIISSRYPNLSDHLSGILRVYSRLRNVFSSPIFATENGTSLRSLTSRDLLKWCDRVAALLSRTTSFSSIQVDDIFMEAFDCFAGSLRSEQSRMQVIACVAEELHIDPQRRDHLLLNREVKLDIPGKGSKVGTICIGRAQLAKHKSSRKASSNSPFSTNGYTLRLLEKIAVAVNRQEPLLLVGETGTGKTTCIQYLAEQLGRRMVAFNLSQQSESGDLLGGYKPVNVRSLVIPLKDEFDELFESTFSRKKNVRFLEMMGKRVAKGEWKRVCMLWREALKMVAAAQSQASSPDPEDGQPKKKRRVDSLPPTFSKARWDKFAADLGDLEAQLVNGSEAFAFSFLEGNIVKAVRNGDWVLLDEINLASPDTLEALTDLLNADADGTPSIMLSETGSVERVVAHPNFRVFAAMNPATDVGKKDLPPGIRSRFTELYVESPDGDPKSLRQIVEQYLGGNTVDPAIARLSQNVTDLYLDIQRLAKSNMLVDGGDQKAHFSLRTLTRTLSYAREIAPLCSLRRALYEGFHMSFLTFLCKSSEDLVAPLIKQHLFPAKENMKAELGKSLQHPQDGRDYVKQGRYWLRKGVFSVEEQPHYIITPFVQRNLNNLIRATSTRRYPVLIQGPTSSGKTSMIEYLAKQSGNKFVRINNHEHTDLQEYLGSYISGSDGKLQFQEGILVRALREGHWIVLDELNLAPTDVLEALNRLLDDNRELLIPETQEVVRPHEDFMLFATQNPAGLYGGRKVLSRAFRNRFLELHFDDIPIEELTEILHRRTQRPESWCKKIVKVYEELSTLRQENRLFEQKSFATLRDLFRWAQRKADTSEELAINGYLLLAERARKEEERQAVKQVIERVLSRNGPRISINVDNLYSEQESPEIKLFNEKAGTSSEVVWTTAMRRLFVLVAHAIRNNEPVLLVGETGCGKTTVCQMLADAFEKELHILNAHQNTETGDLIGAQRPIRNRARTEESLQRQVVSVLSALNQDGSISEDLSTMDLATLLRTYDSIDKPNRDKIPVEQQQEIQINRVKAAALFEWADGSLVHAMKTGQLFLLDEISLADDSVLERLNSVLEPSRTLLLAEKGPIDSLVIATEGFQFLATMNPGGDYGKKELSPALRNRFTEVWVPALSNVEDIMQIVQSKLSPEHSQYASSLVSFAQWFNDRYNTSVASSISIRDMLSWVTFINSSPGLDPVSSVVHGASMVYIDTLGANPAGLLAISPATIDNERKACLQRLSEILIQDVEVLYFGELTDVVTSTEAFRVGQFSIPMYAEKGSNSSFFLEAPTTLRNAMRVCRALQLQKPILLEGNPGVGKTTLVTGLATATGKTLTRLNLSEQTDLMDLFGSDVPVEGREAGIFAWRDAPFLKAMKSGDWVLLDEMNLASQSVLEGLNAVLDHRGEVYISELDQTFHKHPDFRVFAAQNPHHQGGGRKGLPASFVNRFTVVYADVFRPVDLELICSTIFPHIAAAEIKKLIGFVASLDEQVVSQRAFGSLGSPWEFNLRDTLRWLQLIGRENSSQSARDFLDTIFIQRFRSDADRRQLLALFDNTYGGYEPRVSLYHNANSRMLQVGWGLLQRDLYTTRSEAVSSLRTTQLGPMEALMLSVQQSWPVLLVGSSGSGKTAMLNQLASIVGADLVTFSMNADIDAMDLVGGYEQVDPSREIQSTRDQLERAVRRILASDTSVSVAYVKLLEDLRASRSLSTETLHSIDALDCSKLSEIKPLIEKLALLQMTPSIIEGARFQWVDGLLIQALERGKWLVLDNANLCSSAVLDRLNSLLEPNGYLSINEHSTADGKIRIVRPHPAFRIFMTMDPRFGELSRAMRNRAVEICLLSESNAPATVHTPCYPLESALYRFRHALVRQEHREGGLEVSMEHLSSNDMHLQLSFGTELSKGLLSSGLMEQTNGGLTNGHVNTDVHAAHQSLIQRSDFLRKTWHPIYERIHDSSKAIGAGLPEGASYHPMIDELSIQSSPRQSIVHLTGLYDLLLDLSNMQYALETIPSVKFERRSEKQKLPGALQGIWRSFVSWAKSIANAHILAGEVLNAKPLQVLFWALLELVKVSNFDRATFQTYLQMFYERSREISSGEDDLQPAYDTTALSKSLSKELAVFSADVEMSSGHGMERIWKHYKPNTPKTHDQLNAILSLEGLADMLDEVTWKSPLRVDDMIQVRERFASSLHLVKANNVDASGLVTMLSNAVLDMEQRIDQDQSFPIPYFLEEFEGLCQYFDLYRSCNVGSLPASRTLAKATLLARRPTKSMPIDNISNAAQTFLDLAQLLGLDKNAAREMVLQGRFDTALLKKLHGSSEVQLSQLDLFQLELQVLSQHVALHSESLTTEQVRLLSSALRYQVDQLYACHRPVVNFDNSKVEISEKSQISDRYREPLEQLCHTLNEQLQSNEEVTLNGLGQSWINFALVGLRLYVPNYPFDPALRPMLERKLFTEQKTSLQDHLNALQKFQIGFTGEVTSFRIRHTKQELEGLGGEPAVPAIVRPAVSELDTLQGEFTNLLSIIQPLAQDKMELHNMHHTETLRQNISRVIQRLAQGYRVYDDITGPAVGFLVCLYIGLVISGQESDPDTPESRSLRLIAHRTLFIGRHKRSTSPSVPSLLEDLEHELEHGISVIGVRWHVLQTLVTIRSIEPNRNTSESFSTITYNVFHSFFEEWKTRLLKDQDKEAKNTSLYTYHGDEEESEEADPELFPDYETELAPEGMPSTSRDHAIRLSDIHAEIFLCPPSSSDSIKRLLNWYSSEMVRVSGGEAHGMDPAITFPTILLGLEQKSSSLATSGRATTYNFYFDANIGESKRLVQLVHRIQKRFQQIRNVWPEHATLSEVLRTCDEALAFRHVDPVAMLITKMEKLHGYIYEWQRVASKEFSTATLYDDLTSLLVGWRQLELSTWSRLFDIEEEKARKDAKSWFFVAYETIIAAADSLHTKRDMKIHVKDLLKTLDGFFSATTLGQFSQRVQLLRQFIAHVALRMQLDDEHKPLHLALTNFIAYYSRLEKPVSEAIDQGRKSLEKQVNEVIKLASWKDTNIEALRQSAKTSHRKLTKVVRKFRAVLNRPVANVLAVGFPEQSFTAEEITLGSPTIAIDAEALEHCERVISGWSERPTRFKSLTVTTAIMRNKTTHFSEAPDGSTYIDTFVAELESSIAELQKATPTTLTEENKGTVQHLKTQKRKLYADTMKELRQMGFRSNLSSDILARQDELSTVLANLPSISGVESERTRGAEYFLHKTLAVMDQLRSISKEHSGDLTSNDVAKSIGYLESLLNTTVRQRDLLSRTHESYSNLQAPVSLVLSLTASRNTVGKALLEHDTSFDSILSGTTWLAAMLRVAKDVLAAQAKMGQTNELDVVLQGVQNWRVQFEDQINVFNQLSVLPAGICSEQRKSLEDKLSTELETFKEDFKMWTEQYPLARATLLHIQPYVLEAPALNGIPENAAAVTMETHTKDIFAALDLILGAMQDVETALKDLPATTEEIAWFRGEEQAAYNAIIAFHSRQVSSKLCSILDRLQQLENNNHVRAIASMLSVIRPILDQCLECHRYLVGRFEALHLSTTKLFYRLAKSFIQVGQHGFCTPGEKSADQKQGKDEKLEAGTGLGEGEGAEDISKDIDEEDDLEDLAQEKGAEREGSIEEQDDAVDMGEQEMEGDMGEVADKEDQENGEGEEGEDDAESEVGSVDDLGPSAVDEKMWDEGGMEDDAKEKQGKQDLGTENEEEQVAAEEKDKKQEGEQKEQQDAAKEDEEIEMEGEDQDENVGVGETEQMDPHAKEQETLDLPDELNMDGDGDDKEDEDLGDMDMDDEGEDIEGEPTAEPDTLDEEIDLDRQGDEEKDTTGHVEDEGEPESDQESDGPADDDAIPLPDDHVTENEPQSTDERDQTTADTEPGAGIDANDENQQDDNKQASESAANRQEGAEGDASEQKQEANADEGVPGQTAQPQAGSQGDESEESAEAQPFKMIGDALERWYNQQRQISNSKQKDETQIQQIEKEVDMADAEFEHLLDEETQADTQALGTATEEQAKALDQDMAMAVDEDETVPARPEENNEGVDQQAEDIDMQDAELDRPEAEQHATDGRPQAFVGEQKPLAHSEDQDMSDAFPAEDVPCTPSSVEDVEAQLSLTHLDPTNPTHLDAASARALWLHHESTTHSLSQQLTEHLRLILAPTLATKLRGDFRTGKRLNMKRIIPYIASGYKRDKIWLRRSMPSKRSYQVMMALDDSKSMAESGAANLALKTLTLVTRALSMLEVGEVGVVGFGDNISIAHPFDKPFTSEAGVGVFERFGFKADKTDVRGLVHRSLDLFAEARSRQGGAGEELWQLMLVVSDGICDNHAEIQRLVRGAQEERVMIVFIIIDAVVEPDASATSGGGEMSAATQQQQKKTSILDMKSAEVSPEGKVVIRSYMERFPFRYYLVVRDVRELPGVLAGALRQWFGEVSAMGGV